MVTDLQISYLFKTVSKIQDFVLPEKRSFKLVYRKLKLLAI